MLIKLNCNSQEFKPIFGLSSNFYLGAGGGIGYTYLKSHDIENAQNIVLPRSVWKLQTNGISWNLLLYSGYSNIIQLEYSFTRAPAMLFGHNEAVGVNKSGVTIYANENKIDLKLNNNEFLLKFNLFFNTWNKGYNNLYLIGGYGYDKLFAKSYDSFKFKGNSSIFGLEFNMSEKTNCNISVKWHKTLFNSHPFQNQAIRNLNPTLLLFTISFYIPA
jgi:hypothetical protein